MLTAFAEAFRGVAVIRLSGVLDARTYRQARDAVIKAALDQCTAVIVDVDDLGYRMTLAGRRSPAPDGMCASGRKLSSRWLAPSLLFISGSRVCLFRATFPSTPAWPRQQWLSVKARAATVAAL